MTAEKEIDWADSAAVIEAAKPFDKSYEPSRPVMLAGSEIVAFVRHHIAPRLSGGRRFTDSQAFERIAALEAEVLLLQSQNQMLHHQLLKDRRQRASEVEFDRRTQGEPK